MTEKKFSTRAENELQPSTDIKVVVLINDKSNHLLYKDYWDKYHLRLSDGRFSLERYTRNGTGMTLDKVYYNMKNVGRYESVCEISMPENIGFDRMSEIPAPYCGYIFRFNTESGEQYMRLYVMSYDLDPNDRLQSVTVQYSLL